MKEAIILSSYPNTDQREAVLHKAYERVKGLNLPILYVSHLLPKVCDDFDAIIYDKNNILDEKTNIILWYENKIFRVEYPITVPYHGASVYSNLKNIADFCLNKYDLVHFFESDAIDGFDVEDYLRVAREQFINGKDVIGFIFGRDGYTGIPNSIITNILSFSPRLFSIILFNITSWSDYKDLIKIFDRSKSDVLEHVVFDNIRYYGVPDDNIFLMDDKTYNISNLCLTLHFPIFGCITDVKLFITETNGIIYLVIINTGNNEYNVTVKNNRFTLYGKMGYYNSVEEDTIEVSINGLTEILKVSNLQKNIIFTIK